MVTWVHVDDHLHAHPKFKAAWEREPAAVGLYLLALSHSGAYLTNGHVDTEFVSSWIRSARRRERTVGALVGCGLWTVDGDGWEIHDYLDYNESRDHVLERRRRKRGER